ncbi:MAG: hypothetical protein NZ951_07050 [Dehalococcoidia bacterium]|nr:hypothetical protein [Dehalococcoidia bacterium]MDW8120586.1 hypothetical protein [Chloroflexota bacterium]
MTTETERLARLEALLEKVRDRLERFETRLDRLEARQDSQFRWLMGVMLGMWVTVIAAVLGALLTR